MSKFILRTNNVKKGNTNKKVINRDHSLKTKVIKSKQRTVSSLVAGYAAFSIIGAFNITGKVTEGKGNNRARAKRRLHTALNKLRKFIFR